MDEFMSIKIAAYRSREDRVNNQNPLGERTVSTWQELEAALEALRELGFFFRYSHPSSGVGIRSLAAAIKLLPETKGMEWSTLSHHIGTERNIDPRYTESE